MSHQQNHPSGNALNRDRMRATVAVGDGSRSQVTLAREPRVQAEVLGIRNSLLELMGQVYFPKNCELIVDLPQTAETSSLSLHGTVLNAKMIGAEPSYSISVQLDKASQTAFAELRDASNQAFDLASKPSEVSGFPVGAIPGWASLLIANGLISESELRQIADSSRAKQTTLEESLMREGAISKEAIAICVALDQSLNYVEPHAYTLAETNRALIPEQLIRRHGVFPLFHTGGVITLGMKDPADLALIDQVRLRTNCQVSPCICPSGAIDSLIDQAYRAQMPKLAGSSDRARTQREPESLDESDTSGAIVRLVNSMIANSARSGASDVHIEPEQDHLRIRVRVDGILHETATHSPNLHAPIVSRIKVMAKLDIAETRKPQDGYLTLNVESMNVDVRVSTIPTVYGENVVLRLLLSDDAAIPLDGLGMPGAMLKRFRYFLRQPNGMILVTGPTGSGKTSTLYAALESMNSMDRNIVSVEDPVEKRVLLLRQTEVNPKAGVTFASGLRSILRQDPDVIMVGEIRDEETAEIAVQAALTGHLVLSTLHTNTATGAIARLNEMGVTPFLLTSSLRAVIGQRLARRICNSCKHQVEADPRLVAGLGLEDPESITFLAGAGCDDCLMTGYKGRVGLYELLEITDSLRRALLGGASSDVIECETLSALGSSLCEDGLRKVREGLTTLKEVARIVGLVEPSLDEEEV